jgi:hypothetical protein
MGWRTLGLYWCVLSVIADGMSMATALARWIWAIALT